MKVWTSILLPPGRRGRGDASASGVPFAFRVATLSRVIHPRGGSPYNQGEKQIDSTADFQFKGAIMPVQMQLMRIVTSDVTEQNLIYLREQDGSRQFPIVIGMFEAKSIERGAKREASPRPQTHELLVKTVEALGGELDSVEICELRDHIYFAKLRIRKDGEIIEVDSRPSDAIAVAVTCDPVLPIYVAEDVLEETNSGQ